MLLAAGHFLWPVACVLHLVVEQREWAHLHGAGTVPAHPVAGAALVVREDAVQVRTVAAAPWGFCEYKLNEYKHTNALFFEKKYLTLRVTP